MSKHFVKIEGLNNGLKCLVVLGVSLLLLGGCSALPTNQYDVVNGTWITLKGKTSVRFDIDKNRYTLLPKDSESLLFDNYILERSENIVLKEPQISVSLEQVTESQGDKQITYQSYFIKVEMDVMIPEGTPNQIHGIRYLFPNVLFLRDALRTISPTSAPEITFTLSNFTTSEELATTRWWRDALIAIGLIVGAILAMIVALEEKETWAIWLIVVGVATGAVYYWFLTLKSLWVISPAIAVILGITFLLGIAQVIRYIWQAK